MLYLVSTVIGCFSIQVKYTDLTAKDMWPNMIFMSGVPTTNKKRSFLFSKRRTYFRFVYLIY